MAHLALQALRIRLDVLGGGLVAFGLRELQQLRGITDALGGAIYFRNVAAQTSAFAAEFLGAGRIGPDRRLFQLACDFLETLLLAVVFKETPVTSRYARRGL
jgi:hypothetical protein